MDGLASAGCGAVSTQVLIEYCAAAQRKLKQSSTEIREMLEALGSWQIHSPQHGDLLEALNIQKEHQLSWWDSLIVASALHLGCTTLWSEDLSDGRRFGSMTVRNPFLRTQ